jgi:NAD-dependent SIR2 family protein deacetylase
MLISSMSNSVDSKISLAIADAAQAVRNSSALLVSAGAGMGVDSGLPDFRGAEGFWQAYPPYKRLGLRFEQLANPDHFETDPHLAWGFYGHRLNLYRQTKPHAGFGQLLRWAKEKRDGYFVFTSNVDGQFAAAGFDPQRIVECHGSIHHLQCQQGCDGSIWPADNLSVTIDETTMRATDSLPRCPNCDAIARPNILMFGDDRWLSDRTADAMDRYDHWCATLKPGSLCIIECGAGLAVPTVRYESERLARRFNAKLIRINPRDPAVPAGNISLPLKTAEAIARIAQVAG